MINKEQMENAIIRPVLKEMDQFLEGAYSESAVNLMLGTMAVESDFGYHLVQQSANPDIGAKGVFQIENLTHVSIWENYVAYHPELASWVRGKAAQHLEVGADTDMNNQLIWNLGYSLVIARLVYWIAPTSLPSEDDTEGLAQYWKDHYNKTGKGTTEKFMKAYKKYVL